jgi:AAA domain-containing protein
MSSVLPTDKLEPTRHNPKFIIMYGMPKVGKTTALAQLNSCLILDFEDGAASITALRLKMNSIEGKTVLDSSGKVLSTSFDQVVTDIGQYGNDLKAAGKPVQFPYKRIAIDTGDAFQDMCEVVATRKYKDSIIGKNFEGDSVLELSKGAGYGYLRAEVIERISLLSRLCETVILICHTKDKIIDKGGVEISGNELSLTGKLGKIICGKADLIAYLYRESNKPLMASLETSELGVMGARQFPHLKDLYGKRFEFSWNKFLVDAK